MTTAIGKGLAKKSRSGCRRGKKFAAAVCPCKTGPKDNQDGRRLSSQLFCDWMCKEFDFLAFFYFSLWGAERTGSGRPRAGVLVRARVKKKL